MKSKVFAPDERKITVWIVVTEFLAMRYIDDTRILTDEDMGASKSARGQNVIFVNKKTSLASRMLFIITQFLFLTQNQSHSRSSCSSTTVLRIILLH